MPSAIDLAKRSLVGLLKRLATFYVIVLQLNRDASEADVRAAFRNVSRKAHPDRGGRGEDQQKLNGAYEAWQEALKKGRSKPGRAAPAAPPADGTAFAVEPVENHSEPLRCHVSSFMYSPQDILDVQSLLSVVFTIPRIRCICHTTCHVPCHQNLFSSPPFS